MIRLKSASLVLLFSITAVNFSAAQAPGPAPVVVEKVIESELKTPLTFVGAVEPVKRSIVASEIEGLVQSYPAKVGKFVNKGEILAEFQTKTLQISLEEAKAAKKEAKARFNLANANLNRFRKLYEKGITSLQELQDAESEREAQLARIAQLDARIENLNYDLSRSRIKAPFDGFVTEEHTEVGQWVNEGGAVSEIIDISAVKVTADIPERHINSINEEDEVEVRFDAIPDKILTGKVSSVVPQAKSGARTFPVEVRIQNKDYLIKSGMVSRISFSIGKPKPVKLVPKDSIVDRSGSNLVFVVTDGVANPVPVKTGLSYKGLIEVQGPVEKGQLVVIRGNERLRPEQSVKIIDSNGDAVTTP